MWEILKMGLDMNNSPAWQKVNKIMNTYNKLKPSNSARNTYKGAVDNSGLYGAYGG